VECDGFVDILEENIEELIWSHQETLTNEELQELIRSSTGVIKYKITICTLYYIHITGCMQKYVIFGRFKGFSRVILTIRDFGFTCLL
jgi:hypothetical protein